ncbi:MAG: SURF1 family protein [Hyphomicrobiales bacterium]
MTRRLVAASGFSLVAFVILVGLGAWQMQRLHWKEDLIARMEKQAKADPVELNDALVHWGERGEAEYLRVHVQGAFLHDKELHLYDIRDGAPGWRIITPLDTDDAQIVLVDRGFVPDRLKDPAARAQGQVGGEVSLTGAVRAPASEQGQFTPDNEPAANIWYWRDLERMAESALDPEQRTSLVPFFVEMRDPAPPGGWPRPHVAVPRLSNRHLEYALTWFGLAAVLVVMYVLFLRANLKRDSGQP